MRWLLVLIGLWGACLFSPSVLGHGLYVLPYELRVRALRSPQRRLRPAERFSVLVLLSDHHSKSYAEPDGLDQFLPGNYFPDGALFLDDYLKILHAWYLRQMNRLEHYYGPKVAEITGMLQALEPLKDGHSSAVVITRFGKFDEPLAMFRVTVEDAAGLLSSERHFLHLGLEGEPFPRVVAEERLMEVPHLKNVSYGPKTFQFAYPAPSRFSLGWVGANIEAKNYAMDPYTYRRFFPHLSISPGPIACSRWEAGRFPRRFWETRTPRLVGGRGAFGAIVTVMSYAAFTRGWVFNSGEK